MKITFAITLLSFLHNTSAAQFAPGIPLSTNMSDVRELRVVDVDGDSDRDVVVRQTNAIGWFENDGVGNFAPFDTIHASLGELSAFDIADVQTDGLLDLVIADGGVDAILLLLGEGLGEFGFPQPIVGMNGGLVGRLHLANVFAGPEPELLLRSGDILVVENIGGTFGDAQVITTAGGFSFDFQVLDMNADGVLDVANFQGLTPTLSIWLNPGLQGDPWLNVQSNSMGNVGGRPTQALDVDGDGDVDLANAANFQMQWWQFPLEGQGPYFLGQLVDGLDLEPFRRGTTARLGCGAGASMVWTDSINEPVQWATYDAVLGGFGPTGLLTDLPSFLEIGAGDIEGDGVEDLVLWHDGSVLSWYRSLIEVPSTSILTEPFDTLCSSGSAYPLANAVPDGGSWTGPGVVENVFTPTGEGAYELVYTISDATSGCPVSESQVLTVLFAPTVTLVSGDATSNCDTAPLVYSATPAGGTWSGAADEFGVVDRSCAARPLNAGAVYTMNAVNGGSCFGGGALLQLPSCTLLDLGPDQQLCLDQDTLEVQLQGVNAGIAELSGFDEVAASSTSTATGFFQPVNGPGTYEFTGTAIASSSCPAFDTLVIVVDPLPDVVLNLPFQTLVDTVTSVVLSGGDGPNGYYTLDEGTDPVTTIDPSSLTAGPHTITYTVLDAITGCINAAIDTFSVEITTELSSFAASLSVKVVPNPATDRCQVWFSEGLPAQVILHDAVGRTLGVWYAASAPLELDLAPIPAGSYMLSIAQDTRQGRVKFVVH